MSGVGEGARVPAPRRGALDLWMLGAAVFLAAFGLLMVWSASSVDADAGFGNSFHYVSRQLTGLGIGLVGGVLVLRTSWRRLRALALPLYVVSLLLLMVVLTPLGTDVAGSSRWIRLAGFNFQPSELAKVAVVVVLAKYLDGNQGRLRDWASVLPAVLLSFPAIFLVYCQPDFGTTTFLVGLTGALLFFAGLPLLWTGVLGGVVAALLAGFMFLEPYRVRRLVSYMDPFSDPSGGGYQVVQGWIAMANGGVTGQGLGTGLAQYGFLPEAHNDFIAAVVGEELGAVGWLLVVVGQAILVWRGTVLSRRAVDLFGMLVGAGTTLLLGFQAVVNLGVVSGFLPNKGLVLPFMSYGASAAVIHTVCVAMLLRVGMSGTETDRGRG